MQEFQPMKLICSIATIIEQGKAYLHSLALFVEQTRKPSYESSCDSPIDELAEHELALRK